MPSATAKILVPEMVIVEEGLTREVVNVINMMFESAIQKKVTTEETAKAILDSLEIKPRKRDFPMHELLTRIVDSSPDICNGGKKMAALAYRVITAFEEAKPGTVVEVSKEAQELIAKYFDGPEYERADAQGKTEKVKGWPKTINQYVARKTFPYQDAWCAPLTDKQVEEIETKAAAKLLPPAEDAQPEGVEPATASI